MPLSNSSFSFQGVDGRLKGSAKWTQGKSGSLLGMAVGKRAAVVTIWKNNQEEQIPEHVSYFDISNDIHNINNYLFTEAVKSHLVFDIFEIVVATESLATV